MNGKERMGEGEAEKIRIDGQGLAFGSRAEDAAANRQHLSSRRRDWQGEWATSVVMDSLLLHLRNSNMSLSIAPCTIHSIPYAGIVSILKAEQRCPPDPLHFQSASFNSGGVLVD